MFKLNTKTLIFIPVIVLALFIAASFIFSGNKSKAVERYSYWTGQGTDATCGAQQSLNWSCSANWSDNVLPTAIDNVVFDSRSIKDSVIDANFLSQIKSLTVEYGYTGTITQNNNLDILGRFSLNNGKFISDPTKTFNTNDFSLSDNKIPSGTVNAIATDSKGVIYIGGSFTSVSGLPISYLARFDGKQWSKLGDGVNDEVKTIAIDSNDNVYIGGYFSRIGELETAGIAKWNGSQWNNLGGGLKDSLGNATHVTDISITGTNVFAVGPKIDATASLSDLNYIAKWNGSAWEKVGSGLNKIKNIGAIDTVLARGSEIYVGGDFNICDPSTNCTASDTTISANIIKFDGTNWVTIGTGARWSAFETGAYVKDLAWDTTRNLLWMSGRFTSVNGVAIQHVAKFDGTNWSGIGLAYTTTVYAVQPAPDAVYFAGDFASGISTLGTQTLNARRVAKWQNNLIYAVDGGVDNAVYSLGYFNGNIYGTGIFANQCAFNQFSSACTSQDNSPGLFKYNITANKITGLDSPQFNRFSGQGSVESPYLVSDVYGLQAMRLNLKANYRLSSSIDAASTSSWPNGFLPVGEDKLLYKGIFDGNNFEITNLNLNKAVSGALFGATDTTAQVKNLKLSTIFNGNFSALGGALVGLNNGLVDNVEATVNFNVSGPQRILGYRLGGLIGENRGTISNSRSSVSGQISNIGTFGGLVGLQSKGKIENSSTSGKITINNSPGRVGGLVGAQEVLNSYGIDTTEIVNSNSTLELNIVLNDLSQTVDRFSKSVGGLVGLSQFAIKNSYANNILNCTVSDPNASCYNFGGLVGESQLGAKVSDSYSLSTLSFYGQGKEAQNIGGLVGSDMNGTIANSSAKGDLKLNFNGSVARVGGFIGYANQSTINNSYQTGNISIGANTANGLSTKDVGGFTGYVLAGNFQKVNANGNVTVAGNDGCKNINGGRVGGFAGLVDGSYDSAWQINDAYALGNVSASCSKVGGFAGQVSGGVSESFSGGSVSGNQYVGGFVGFIGGLNAKISDSFSFGDATVSGEYVGGFAGIIDDAELTNVFSKGNASGAKAGGFSGAYDSTLSRFTGAYYLKDVQKNESLSDSAEELLNSYLGTNRNTNVENANITALTTVQSKSGASYLGWDFTNVWQIAPGASYPYLKNRSEFEPTVNTLASQEKTNQLNGSIAQTGFAPVYFRGFEYKIGDQSSAFGEEGSFSTGDFSIFEEKLPPSTTVSYRAVAASIFGANYGEFLEVETAGGAPVNFNVNISGALQAVGSGNFTASLKVYQAGGVQVLQKDLNFSGNKATAELSLTEQNYDFSLSANGFLTKKITNRLYNSALSLDFGTLLAGDVDQNNKVDNADLAIIKQKWFSQDQVADINRDGIVNSLDYAFALANYLTTGD